MIIYSIINLESPLLCLLLLYNLFDEFPSVIRVLLILVFSKHSIYTQKSNYLSLQMLRINGYRPMDNALILSKLFFLTIEHLISNPAYQLVLLNISQGLWCEYLAIIGSNEPSVLHVMLDQLKQVIFYLVLIFLRLYLNKIIIYFLLTQKFHHLGIIFLHQV